MFSIKKWRLKCHLCPAGYGESSVPRELSSRGLTIPCEFSVLFIHKSEVISLQTSGKRLPGKELAIYVGVVIAVLVLAYSLTKDLSFILVCDKEGVFNSI